MNKGRLFIISGPSGSGKDTVMKELFKLRPNLEFSISSITRPMREGEVQGEKYNFISREEFENMLDNNQLLEHNVFLGNYYGTPLKPVLDCIDSGKDMMIEVDVNGAAQIRGKMPGAVSIFILPPSLEILKNRLFGRATDEKAIIEKRVDEAIREIKRANEYDYVVVNDDLQKAIADVDCIINSDSFKVDRNLKTIENVLNK